MKLKADFFPYPVLSESLDDYVDSSFSSAISKILDEPDRYQFKVTFSLNNMELNRLINQNRITYAVHIEGEASSFRKLIKAEASSNEIVFTINADEAPRKLFVNTIIIANENIRNYSNQNFNPIYYDEKFFVNEIKSGDILAFTPTFTIDFHFENKDSSNPKSMIKVASYNEDVMKFDIDGNSIYVYLPEDDYQAYSGLSKSSEAKQKLLLVTIVLPTFTYALERIANKQVDSSLEWYQSLERILESRKLSIESLQEDPAKTIEYAQKLLGNPVKDSLNDFYNEESKYDEH